MYPVSDEYKAAIKEITREFQLVITILPAEEISIEEVDQILATVVAGVDESETTMTISSIEDVKAILATVVKGIDTPAGADEFVLHDDDIVTKTFKVKDNLVSGEDIEWGNVISKDLSFTITNYNGQWNYVNLARATIIPLVGLKTASGYEYIPIGTFWADTVGKPLSIINITALDGMARLNVPFSQIIVNYPCTLQTLFFQICDQCNIRTKITSFPNDTVTVQQAPADIEEATCRDILGYIAQIAGCNMRMSRDNYLELIYYGDAGEISLEPQNRTSFVPEDYSIKITGISYKDFDGVEYFMGSNDYVIQISENPLMPADPSIVLDNLLNVYSTFSHQPFTLSYFGDPAVDCGDKITNIHVNGKIYTSYVTNNTFTFKGSSTLEGKGRLPEISQSPTKESKQAAKMVAIIRKQQKESEQRFTEIEDAILNSTQFLTAELGGYVYKTEDVIYIMDTKDINTATKIWKWSLGGLGYSSSGKDGPYTTAITMDGAIVADFIRAGLMSADRIRGGTLKLGGIDNTNGIFELYDASNFLIALLDKSGFRVNAKTGDYVSLNAEQGFVGYDKNGNKVYWADGQVFHMRNAEIENETSIAGIIKLIPVITEDNIGIGFAAISQE